MIRSRSFALTLAGITGGISYFIWDDNFRKTIEKSHAFPFFVRKSMLEPAQPEMMRADGVSNLLPQDTIKNWKVPQRKDMIEKLKNSSLNDEEFDLLIIGGGATGTGVALDAVSRGLKVALVEKDDFASGTSSKSTKLVHGGVRYLEKAVWNLDREQYELVNEALAERFTVLKIAPYLTSQLPIMCPIYSWWKLPYYYLGTKAYDWVSGKRGFQSSYFLSRSKALQEFPMLLKDNLYGAIVYYDGQQNDSRMNAVLALTASYYGASMANHVEVVSLLKNKQHDGDLKVSGAVVKDCISGEQWEIRAKGVVNATGPFTDFIRKMDDENCQPMIAPSSGAHICLPHYYGSKNMGLIDPASSDGRVIFFLPWEGVTVAGTTDSPSETVTLNPKATENEVDFILKEVSHYLNEDIIVRKQDILSSWSGIRPLVKNPKASNTESIVRSHLIDISDSGLLTIAGGKWTTYRKMAEETVDAAISEFNLAPRSACVTENLLLIGSHYYNPNSFVQIVQKYGIDTDVAQHLTRNYGDRAKMVAELTAENSDYWPRRGRRLIYPYPYLEAEVRFAARNEFACTATDIIARRTRLAFLDARAAYHSLPRVIEILGEELEWGRERKLKEYQDSCDFLQTMGLNLGDLKNTSF